MIPNYCRECGKEMIKGKVVDLFYNRETGKPEGTVIHGRGLRTCERYHVEDGHDQFILAYNGWVQTPRPLKGEYETK